MSHRLPLGDKENKGLAMPPARAADPSDRSQQAVSGKASIAIAGHTELPWCVEQGTDLIWGACNPDDSTSYGMGYSIVQGRSGWGTWAKGRPDMDEREANAAFIVQACNSHYELIEALREVVEDNRKADDPFWWTQARDALLKARGQSTIGGGEG